MRVFEYLVRSIIQKVKYLIHFLLKHRKKVIVGFLLAFIVLASFSFWYIKHTYYFEKRIVNKIKTGPSNTNKNFDYTIVLVGDSSTEYLGNLEELGYFLNKYYPQKNFLLLNYGYSSTNILSLPDRIEKDTFHNNRIYQPINNIDFDLIIIESFGNNPLMEYPLEVGLQKHNEILDEVISEITKKHDKSRIVFLATVAPSQKYYGLGEVDLTPEKRKEWADIRSAYILNHIAYAKSHDIPIIDLYHQTLTPSGDGDTLYLNKLDYIHPSLTGIFYMDDNIAKFIHQNNLIAQ